MVSEETKTKSDTQILTRIFDKIFFLQKETSDTLQYFRSVLSLTFSGRTTAAAPELFVLVVSAAATAPPAA